MTWSMVGVFVTLLVGTGMFLDGQHFDENQRSRIRSRLSHLRTWLVSDPAGTRWHEYWSLIKGTFKTSLGLTVLAFLAYALVEWLNRSYGAGEFKAVSFEQLVPNDAPILSRWWAELHPTNHEKVATALGVRPRSHWAFALGFAVPALMWLAGWVGFLVGAAGFLAGILRIPLSHLLGAAAKPTRKPFMYLGSLAGLVLTAVKGFLDVLRS